MPSLDVNAVSVGCSNSQAVVLQDDLLKHLRIPHKHFSSLTLCVRAQLYASGHQLQRMLERSVLRRAGHSALLEADKVAVIPLSSLRKVESSLEQLCRRSSSKSLSSTSAAALLDLQSDSESSLIRHLGEMSLTHRGDDAACDEDSGGDVKGKCGLTSLKAGVTSAKSGAWRVLGETVPAAAVPGAGSEKAATTACIKSERTLIAPSSLSNCVSLPPARGFSHSSSSQFSRNWSGKFSASRAFSDQASSASCADRASLSRAPNDKLPASYDRKGFSGLFSDMPSRDMLGKLAGSQSSGQPSDGQRLSETSFS